MLINVDLLIDDRSNLSFQLFLFNIVVDCTGHFEIKLIMNIHFWGLFKAHINMTFY